MYCPKVLFQNRYSSVPGLYRFWNITLGQYILVQIVENWEGNFLFNDVIVDVQIFFFSRVGWTVDDAGLDLGEVPHSYGYEGTGKIVENNTYQTYGELFGPGDVIGCYVVC